MRSNGLKALVIMVILTMILITACARTRPKKFGISGLPCVGVYKTRADYYDFQRVMIDDEFHMLTASAHPNTKIKLAKGYIAEMIPCSKQSIQEIAFTNISISKWKEQLINCSKPFQDFEYSLVVKYCKDPAYAWKVMENPPLEKQQGMNQNKMQVKSLIAFKQTGGACMLNLTTSESQRYESLIQAMLDCEEKIRLHYTDPEFLRASIIDKNPFTEFYACNNTLFNESKLNKLINENQLSVVCKRLI